MSLPLTVSPLSAIGPHPRVPHGRSLTRSGSSDRIYSLIPIRIMIQTMTQPDHKAGWRVSVRTFLQVCPPDSSTPFLSIPLYWTAPPSALSHPYLYAQHGQIAADASKAHTEIKAIYYGIAFMDFPIKKTSRHSFMSGDSVKG